MFTPTTGGIKFFQYDQVTPMSTWTIYHAFGCHPIIDINVIDANGKVQKAFPVSIEHVDNNTAIVRWSSPRAGFATLASTPTAV
jgi:hypothetical protein